MMTPPKGRGGGGGGGGGGGPSADVNKEDLQRPLRSDDYIMGDVDVGVLEAARESYLSSSAPTPTAPRMQPLGGGGGGDEAGSSSTANTPLLGGEGAARPHHGHGSDDDDDDDDDDGNSEATLTDSDSDENASESGGRIGLDGQRKEKKGRRKSAATRAMRGTAKYVTRRLGLSSSSSSKRDGAPPGTSN